MTMKWQRNGLIFNLNNYSFDWLRSHAMTPTPILMNDRIRVFYAGRNLEGQCCVSFFDLDLNDHDNIINYSKHPVLLPGKKGRHDDCGVICTSAVIVEKKLFLYYTAYSIAGTVPYRNSIGVAYSDDYGESFTKTFPGPILDRTNLEPYFVISPCVIKSGDQWHMWYASCTDWIEINSRLESLYHIKYASSINGVDWHQKNITCIPPEHKFEANARPSVIIHNTKLHMWYTYRGSNDFRDGVDSYKIAYAQGNIKDPTTWENKAKPINFVHSKSSTYDSSMQSYPGILQTDSRLLMFYNGNGFGIDGVCLATLDE